jgi:hypothetical protein
MKRTYIFNVHSDLGSPAKQVKVKRVKLDSARDYIERLHPLKFIELDTIKQ